MKSENILVCVSSDPGIGAWLDRALEGQWPLEFVASTDLARVNRLIEATQARLILVTDDEEGSGKSLRTIQALKEARPDLLIVAMSRRLQPNFVLHSMRSGAQDCFFAGEDSAEIRARISQLLQGAPGQGAVRSEPTRMPKVSLITSPSPLVDTRFFAQNLIVGLHRDVPEQRILGIDTMAGEHSVFYLDSNNSLSLERLMANPETLDQAMIETALEEYAPNVRLLSGRLSEESPLQDRNADLFIAISQLGCMFDQVVINVNPAVADYWVNAIGLHARDLVMVSHPVVEQAHESRRRLDAWGDKLRTDCVRTLVLDNYEKKGAPKLEELRQAMGGEYLGALPTDWSNRLLAINAGLPVQSLVRKTRYQKELDRIIKRYQDKFSKACYPDSWRRVS